MGVVGRCGRKVVISDISSPQSSVIRVFSSAKILVASLCKFWCCSANSGFSSMVACYSHKLLRKQVFTFVRDRVLWCLFDVELWAFGTIRQEWRFGITTGTVSVLIPASDLEDSFDSRLILHAQKVE